MEAGDRLAPYFRRSPRHSPQLSGRDGVRGRVDAIVNELSLPAQLDDDGDWRFEADPGTFSLLITADGDQLVVLQQIRQMQRPVRNEAELMQLLLMLHVDFERARFAAGRSEDEYYLMLTARLAVAEIDRDAVERLLVDALELSRQLDEATGREPVPQAAPPVPPEAGSPEIHRPGTAEAGEVAASLGGSQTQGLPPAGWYPDPSGEGQRWWDGERWSERTAP